MKVGPPSGAAVYDVFEQFGSFADNPEAATRPVRAIRHEVVRAEGEGGVKRCHRLFMTALGQKRKSERIPLSASGAHSPMA